MIASADTSIILVNWNGWADVVECLGSLLHVVEPPRSIIVVDNASTDGSVSRIEAWCAGEFEHAPQASLEGVVCSRRAPADLRWASLDVGAVMPSPLPQVLLLRSSRNTGFAGGNNLGLAVAAAAGCRAHWLLNTDTVVAPHSLVALLRRLDERPSAGAVGSTLVYYWRPERVQARGGAVFHPWTGGSQHLGVDSLLSDLPQDPGPTEQACSYIVGASMLITQDWLARVGPMCEDYFLYYEEIDWAERGRPQGFELAWAPDSLVFHKVGGSSRKRASRLSLRYLYRNRLVFTRRFHPGMRGRVVRAMGRQLVHHALRGHWDDVRELMGAIWAFRREWLVL